MFAWINNDTRSTETFMPTKFIFTSGNSGTRPFLNSALEAAYQQSGKTVYVKDFANNYNNNIPTTRVARYHDSTFEELEFQIKDFIEVSGTEFDVVIFTGWRIKMFIESVYTSYRDKATFVFVKENTAFGAIDPNVTQVAWNANIPTELEISNTINATVSSFYVDYVADNLWKPMALNPTVELSPIRINTESGPHMYAILGQGLE
jgi:hypothetical protein